MKKSGQSLIRVYPFSESIEAITHLATGRAKGKIVMKMS